jgi:hypothetical protein
VDNFRFVGRQPGWLGQYDRLEKTPAAVTFANSSGVEISRCRFAHLGAAALALERGSVDDRIVANDFVDDGATAIELGDVFDHHSATPVRRIAVEDNVIHDVAAEYQGGVGIWAGFVADTTIAHNELRDLPYTAISVGWGWGKYDRPPTTAGRNTIEANLISDVVQVLGDGGGIYLNGAQPDTVVRGNAVHGNRNWGGALYLDDGSTGESVEDNVVWDTHQWPYMFKAADVTIRDNWWDFTSDWGWAFFQGGVVADNHVVTNLPERARAIVEAAGIRR